MELGLEIVLFLVFCAFVAGFVDAIAGGGALITIPVLLSVGIPPIQALGTNKMQSTFGSFSAALYFFKHNQISLKEMRGSIIAVFIFGAFGAILVQYINAKVLSSLIPFLLIAFAFYFLFSPKMSDSESKRVLGNFGMMVMTGIVGFYDGFFGPGTGSFFALIFIALGGYGVTRATANAKLLNFTSNLASLLFFALGGEVLVMLGILMGIGQYFGAQLGSKAALKHGSKLIKPLMVTVSLAISCKLLWQQYLA